MPNPFRIARAVAKPAAPPKGALSVLPAAERDANLQRMLSESKVQQRLYHGTTATEGGKGQEAIRRFKPSKSGSLGSGTYLTPNSAQASGYSGIPNDDAIQAMLMSDSRPTRLLGLESYKQRGSGDVLPSQQGGNMLPVYAQVKNPLIIDGAHPDPMVEALIKLGMDEDKAGRMVERAYENKGYIGKEVQQRAQAQGYDGLMQYRNGDLSEVVTYNPNAVKSAIGNRGTYDTTKPDLNEAGGGLIKGAMKALKGTQKVLPAPEREANKAKFLSDSKIKDRLYHATPENFKEFKPGGKDPTLSGPATWLSTDPKHQPAMHNISAGEGKFREGVNVMPVHVQAKNPLVLDDPTMIDWARTVFAGGSREFPELMAPKWVDEVRGEGYDSIMLADPFGKGHTHEVIMFEPNKIKSAIGNRGTYDTSKPDINKAKGGEVKMAEGGAVNHEGNTMKLPHDVIPRKHIDAHSHAHKHFMKGGAVNMRRGGGAKKEPMTLKGELESLGRPLQALADTGAGLLRGTVAGTLGMPGEIESLGRGAGAAFSAPSGQRFDAFLQGMGQPTVMPKTEDISAKLPSAYSGSDKDRQHNVSVGQTFGEFIPAPGTTAATRAGVKGAKYVGREAARMVDDAMMGGNNALSPLMTAPSFAVDPKRKSAFVDKFGQKQEQEAARQKKVEKLAQESAGKSPEASVKPAKSKGRREAVPPDIYRQMAKEFGDEAVLKAATAGEHLKPTGSGYIGAPRTVTNPQGLGGMRRTIDKDFADSVEALELSDPTRLGTWYDRAKQGLAESSEPYQLPRVKEQHSVYSAGVSPESETGFTLKHHNSRVAGEPTMAYRGSGMRTLDTAVAQDRPAKLAFKIGEYGEKNDPRLPNTGLFGVNDFRRAQGMTYTDPQGNPWKAGVSATMHPFMDAETALQVNRANTAGLGGRTDWQGPHIQELPWVYGKAQDFYGRGKNARYKGDEFEGMSQAMRDANNTARDYFYKHAASATHEQIPGVGVGHVRQALNMTPEGKLAYGREGRFDMPAPEMALNEFPQVGAGNRDAIYGALGYRQLPSRDASGLYINSLGEVEKNPMTIARPLMDFPTGGGGGRMSESSSKMMDTAEQFRALIDAQEAGAYNLPNTMSSVKGKNAMVLDTRGQVADPLADPSAGVLPSADQLGQITNALNAASGKAEKAAKKVRDKMPYGPPTKSVHNKLVNLDDAAGGYGVTATNRGALIFPYNSQAGGGGLNEIMKISGKEIEGALPGARREKAIASTGYVPGVGKRTSEGPQLTAPYSGEATSDMLQAFSELPQSVSLNLSESEAVRSAIRAKALRDSKMGGTRGDIQETRRFFSEADWPKAVDMIRRGMTPAAALAALGYSASSMAGER